MRHQEVDDQNQEKGRCPRWYLEVGDLKVRILAEGLYGLAAKEQEHPYAGAYRMVIDMEDESLKDGIEATWYETKGPGEEDECYDCAMF